MIYDLKESFTFVKSDQDALKKLLIGGAISLVSIFLLMVPMLIAIILKAFNASAFAAILVCGTIGVLGLLSIYGYILQAGQDRINDRSAILPDWKGFWGFVFTGFKSNLGMVMYLIPVILFAVISLGFSVLEENAKAEHLASYRTFVVLSYIAGVIYQGIYLFFTFFQSLMTTSFMTDFNVFAYLNFKKAYRLVKGNFLDYFILVILILAVAVVTNIAVLVLTISIIGIALTPFVVFYTSLVTIDLIARFANAADNEVTVK